MAEITILNFTDVERDAGLETAILISIFTDSRVPVGTNLPENSKDYRGWWADSLTDKIGSKLWLLFRSSGTADIPSRCEEYIKDSLGWMIEDGVAKDVIVETSVDSSTLLMTIKIVQPLGTEKFYKYAFNWEAELLKRG